MKLEIEWQRYIPLKYVRSGGIGTYEVDLDKFPQEPGIYIFARKWSNSYEALYIGQSTLIRKRIKYHMNSVKLMRHIHKAKTGNRIVLYGKPITKPGQKMAKILNILEKALIKHFLRLGHDIVNS